jgi:lysophospholipase L1-like esterase
LLLTFISLPYLAWEIYWFSKVGYACLKLHTHLALYFYLWLVYAWSLKGIHNYIQFKNFQNYNLLGVILLLLFVFLEILLITLGIGDTYAEKIKTGYWSRYNSTFETKYRTHNPNEQFYIRRPEFNHIRICNSLGFSDVEWSLKKRENEKRILVLGDSFTEGVGAPFDSCYPSILRVHLSSIDSNISVMNAGIAGDDPCVNFLTYRDLLLKYKPDIILQTLSSNDLNTDIATKGGLERFKKAGVVTFQQAPWWEPIYAFSYISRIFYKALGYNELLLKCTFSSEQKSIINKESIELFQQYEMLAKESKAKLIIVLQPNQSELYKGEYDYDLMPIIQPFQNSEATEIVDLLPYYLEAFKGKESIIKDYYWTLDGHHNPKGYVMMANGIEKKMSEISIIPSK